MLLASLILLLGGGSVQATATTDQVTLSLKEFESLFSSAKLKESEQRNELKWERYEKEYQQKFLNVSHRVNTTIRHSYGFVINPNITHGENLAQQFASTPVSICMSCPHNLTCHNLCSISNPPTYY